MIYFDVFNDFQAELSSRLEETISIRDRIVINVAIPSAHFYKHSKLLVSSYCSSVCVPLRVRTGCIDRFVTERQKRLQLNNNFCLINSDQLYENDAHEEKLQLAINV
ncbi:hypothetical protein T03_1828 [Trichinella britovi]|uniref:Uncharacterized protein n=1 Tax=Trichinella britovi TaxID=45882 RepID=A0A0V1D502_TRIBR|nr:hypothetical protein T03_1828 [Trichinella britovi]